VVYSFKISFKKKTLKQEIKEQETNDKLDDIRIKSNSNETMDKIKNALLNSSKHAESSSTISYNNLIGDINNTPIDSINGIIIIASNTI